jgi:hypothetical protein
MKIDELLILPEGKTLEFKRDLSSPKPVLLVRVAHLPGIAQNGVDGGVGKRVSTHCQRL